MKSRARYETARQYWRFHKAIGKLTKVVTIVRSANLIERGHGSEMRLGIRAHG